MTNIVLPSLMMRAERCRAYGLLRACRAMTRQHLSDDWPLRLAR